MATSPDPSAILDALRASGVRIDREGDLWHGGARIEHPGVRAALFRWLTEEPDGRHVFRVDALRFAWVEVEDAPLVVRTVRPDGDGLVLLLSDGSGERLVPATLRVDAKGALRCRVRCGALGARFSTSALAVIGDALTEVAGRMVLHLPDGTPVVLPEDGKWPPGGGS